MHESSLASNVLVEFPFENKSLAGQRFPTSTCGVHLPTLDLYLVGTNSGLMFAWNAQLELVCEVQNNSQSPVLALCVEHSILLALQQDGTLNAYNAQTLEERAVQESIKDTILQAVGEPLAMCVCGEGRFVCVAGKRSKSLLILHIDTLAPAHLLHAQVDFVVCTVAAYGNLLVSCNAQGLVNVWRYSSQHVGFAQTCTQCKLEFVLKQGDNKEGRSVVKFLLVNANTLVIVTSWGECVLAHGFGGSNEGVIAANSALLRSTALDIQFSNDDLYILLDNGAVLRFDHYMTQHPVVPAAAGGMGINNTHAIMIPSSSNKLLLSTSQQQKEVLALYSEQQVLHTRTRAFESRPLTVLVPPNNKVRTKHQSVVCKQVAPGVLRAACFPQIPEDQHDTNSSSAYTCLEYVEHANGFFLLAGKDNGTLDVFTCCLPLLAKLPTATVDLCLHKSFLTLHLGRIDSIVLVPSNHTSKPLVCTICNANFEVILLNSTDFSLVHRFAGHQSPIQHVESRWPFLHVRCESNKTFVWNMQSSGALERIVVVDTLAPSRSQIATRTTTTFALMDIAREMNGLESSSLGQSCGAVLSLLHKWGINEDVDTICQTVFGFSRNAARVPVRFVERGKFSSIAIMSHEGDVSWSRLVQFSTKHMVHVCSMYYLLSQYEPNFHPLFTFYCVELPPEGRGDLSVDGLVDQFAHGKTNHIVIRLLVCQQLERIGREKRKLLLEKWSARVLELRDYPKPQLVSGNVSDPLQLKRELSTLHPVMEECAVDPALILLLVKNAEYQHLAVLLAISCGTHMEEVSPLAARMITEALVESVSIAAAGIDSFLACDLLGLGFMLFRPHIAHMSRLIRSLLHLLVGGDDVERTDSVRHLLKRIGLAHPVLTIRTIGNELLDVNQTQQFRVAVTELLVHFSRDEETAVSIMLKYLVMIVEILMKTLDPHDAAFRRQCFPTSSAVLQQLVRRFPMCAFHQTSQRFALGTLESTILVYDVRTATKLKVLDGSDCGPCSALAFDHTGEKIASYSSCEHCVRVWTTHAGFFDNFHVRGTLLAKHPLVRLETKPNVQQTIRSCRLSWDQLHEVKLRREDSKVVAIRV